jgi:hypothetical protein
MSDGIDGSVVALATPEFSIKRILRPFKGFEAIYQGLPASTPICFCERNLPYDPIAKRGVPGYDPHLVYGVPGNMGTRCSIEFPMTFWSAGGALLRYRYSLNWRLRNTRDHNTNPVQRVPYHIAKSGAGVPETTPPSPGPRVTIYGIRETAIYAQTEPTGLLSQPPASVVIRPLWIEPVLAVSRPPKMPDGSDGVIQQGILPPAVGNRHTSPYFLNYETQSIGDDLVIGVVRDDDVVSDWEFGLGETDHGFSIFFGNGDGVEYEDLGILLSWGVAP